MTNESSVVEEVRRAVPEGCLSTRCRKEGCTVSMRGVPEPWLLIDLDHPQAPADLNETRCDYIFIGGSGSAWVAPLELKSGRLRAREIVPQLQAGAAIADKIVPRNAEVQFRPIAVYGGSGASGFRTSARGSQHVRFRNRRVEIRLHKCRTPLALALR